MTRIVSFCFDDGFLASAQKIVRLFEERACLACFCVLAAPSLARDPYIMRSAIADWPFWRELRAAGHEVAPHGYAHERLADLGFETACASVRLTWEVFEEELPGFDRRRSIFNLAYLRAPETVVDWIAAHSLGVRGAFGGNGRNDPAAARASRRIDCITFGGADAERRVASRLTEFIDGEDGWLVLVLHGVDGEGWGSISTSALATLLDRAREAQLRIAPPSAVLLERAPPAE